MKENLKNKLGKKGYLVRNFVLMFMVLCAASLAGNPRGREKVANENDPMMAEQIDPYANIDDSILSAALVFAETKDLEDAKNIFSVINNRTLRPKRFGKTRREVITAPSQFSGLGSKEFQKAVSGQINKEESEYFKELLRLSKESQSETWVDTVDGADQYYNPKLANPKWGTLNTPKSVKKGHFYYKPTIKNKFHSYFKETLR